ncbi:MAG: Alkaline phosphatase synthesis sensor protein PhoR [Anaerolineales bacterium]|nr:Alkaline phosphatase synthesis sensor protein PhoR [Anaerolineales bacterium]
MTSASRSPLRGSRSTLTQEELVNSLSWLVKMRWVAGGGVLLVTWFSAIILDLNVPTTSLYLLGLGLLVYNALLRWGVGRLDAAAFSNTVYEWFVRFQIGVDWAAMALLIHFSGGIESPAILYFLFHITIASLLLPHDRGYLYVALAPILVGGVALLEYSGVLRHVPVFTPARYADPLYVAGILFFFVSASYVMVYFSMTISRRLRRRENELAALYESVQATTSTLDLTEVLNRLAEATTQALGCKGAAIRLLDKTGSHLAVAGSYGLSEDYLDKDPIDVARAPIDQEVLSGKTVLVPDTSCETRLRYPDKVASEGIHCILIAPLVGKRGPIGVLRAYGIRDHCFLEDDVDFLSAIAAQGAVAIENAQAYQMLEYLDRSKSEFVRIVTHELRSPVQVAGSLLNVLSRGYVGELNAEQADLVGRAQRRIKFLQALIDDLLDLAAGKAEVMATAERGLVSLTDVFEEVRARYESPAQDKGIALQALYPDEPLKVWGDRSELDRMMTNLVSNAVKYTREGEVRLELERTNGSARVVIADTGIGIPEDALPRLFEEFFRAKNAKDLQETGTGLGLSIVKDLVKRYDGEIQVDSVEGEGTTFTLMLPLAKNDANALEK